MLYPLVTIDSTKVANVLHRHPWIFSGAVVNVEKGAAHGGLVHVADPQGKVLGVGTYSTASSIAVRVLDFTNATINIDWFVARLQEADARRGLMGYGIMTDTTGYRVVFGESDGLPGLVVDRYEDVLVFQIATAGMDALREMIVEALVATFKPRLIVERSDMPSRREENLKDVVGVAWSKDPSDKETDAVEFRENGLRFMAHVQSGQKTGFFLDQKDTRRAIRSLADKRSVLNLFSYTGAAGVAAMAGGAASVHGVDASAAALAGCAEHARLNKIAAKWFTTEEADVFQWIGATRMEAFGMVMMDPPALIKSRKDIEEGKKAYHFLNRAALRLVANGGIFITSSCSHFLNEEDFAFLLRRASVQAGVSLSILQVLHQSPDHPLSVYFSEAAYLKTFVCQVFSTAKR